MTNSMDRGAPTRGQRTREALVAAGIALLAEGGWEAITTRAVATRADSNPGLIHYHFGGLGGLRLALAARASDEAIGPLVSALLRSADVAEAIDALQAGITDLVADDRRVRLAAELTAGASHDPELGAAFRENLREARSAIGDWVAARHPRWPADRTAGVAALVAALLDGLLLHRALDPHAPLPEALATLRAWADVRDA